MAWTRVQSKIQEGATTPPATFAMPSSVTAGNLLVVGLTGYTAGGQTYSVADGVNTYALAGSKAQGNFTAYVWYAKNVAGGATTLTVSGTSSPFPVSIDFAEYSGLDTSAPLDSGNVVTAGGTTGTALSASTSSASGNLIYAAGNQGPSTGSYTATSGFAKEADIPGFTNRSLFSVQGTATGSSQVAGVTDSGAPASWGVVVAPFALASAAGATTYTLSAAPSPDTVNSAVTATVTPDGVYTGTITVTPTGSASTGLSAQTLTWSGTSTAQTCSFTPTVTGTLTLTGTNNQTLTNPSAVNVTVNAAPNAVAIATPVQYQAHQQSGGSRSIAMAGTYTGATSIEASVDASTWTLVANNSGTGTLSGGNWTGTLAAVPTGQYTLSVRLGNDHATTASVTFVTVTDVIAIGGQSNAMSGSFNVLLSTPYSGAMTRPTKLVDPATAGASTPGTWAPGSPKIHTNAATGDPYLMVADGLQDLVGCQPCWVPGAITGTSITEWQPGNANGYYTAWINRIKQCAPARPYCRVVIWYQGESDAQAGMSQSTYFANYQTLAAQVYADTGARMMPTKIHQCTNLATAPNIAIINAAIAQAWAQDPNTLRGPDFSDINEAGATHPSTDATCVAEAQRWQRAIAAMLYLPRPLGAGPVRSNSYAFIG